MDLRLNSLNTANLTALRQAASPKTAGAAAGGPGAVNSSFGEAFKTALSNVSEAQNKASEMQTQVQLGNPNVSLEETMMAMQKAQVGFTAALHVRNRMMQAYTDVMNMQV